MGWIGAIILESLGLTAMYHFEDVEIRVGALCYDVLQGKDMIRMYDSW